MAALVFIRLVCRKQVILTIPGLSSNKGLVLSSYEFKESQVRLFPAKSSKIVR
jgi:hypothetical protein